VDPLQHTNIPTRATNFWIKLRIFGIFLSV
jgi:hypothetical protein